ncbi:hypothetical protein DFH06DRAFT_1159316 [Mycena polygramma]|nr:hypothetical protein DFH06DRAFT_1159316 [Mycena polygramma]
MHRAWQIGEVMEMICAQVALDGPIRWWSGRPVQAYPRRRRDLSCLARTSTIFLNPALDVLWEYQDTLLHLLRTMPNDLWDITETRLNEEEQRKRRRMMMSGTQCYKLCYGEPSPRPTGLASSSILAA